MKHFLFCLVAGLILASCEKTPANGDLDGEWILQEIHSKASASQPEYSEYSDKRATPVFWNVALQLVGINTPGVLHNGKTEDTMCRFVYAQNRLSITHTYVHYRDRDSLLTDPSTRILENVGIRGNATDYRVVRLTSSRLVLCSPLDSLVFRKKH